MRCAGVKLPSVGLQPYSPAARAHSVAPEGQVCNDLVVKRDLTVLAEFPTVVRRACLELSSAKGADRCLHLDPIEACLPTPNPDSGDCEVWFSMPVPLVVELSSSMTSTDTPRRDLMAIHIYLHDALVAVGHGRFETIHEHMRKKQESQSKKRVGGMYSDVLGGCM